LVFIGSIKKFLLNQEITIMSPKQIRFSQSHRTLRAIMALLLPLVLAALACNFQTGDDQTLRETDIAISIQQTLIALTATALEAELLAPPATEPPPSAPEATETPLPTQVEAATQPPLPSDTPTAEASPTLPILESIPLTEWGLQYWAPINSGCTIKDAPCWKMDDNYNKHLGSAYLTLIGKTPLLLDESWPNPYLTFWHKYKFERTANIDIQVEGRWINVMNLSNKTSGGRWIQEAINLKNYQGKEIIVRFTGAGIWGSGGIKGSDWFVNDINVIPDYKP